MVTSKKQLPYILIITVTLFLSAAYILAPTLRPTLDTLKTFRAHKSSSLPQSSSPPQSSQGLYSQRKPWLLATISAAHAQTRRNIIRSTWQTYYRSPHYTTRFIIANPTSLWLPLIAHENNTYGDLIMLPHLEESSEIANTIKTVEFLKHLVANGTTHHFVSKIDDDSFLDADRMFEEFIAPRIAAAERDPEFAGQQRNFIARKLDYARTPNGSKLDPLLHYPHPGGQFYTMSWEMVVLLARLHEQNRITDELEDSLLGRLLYEAHEAFEFVELSDERAFDTDEDLGGMSERAINPHKMKSDELYLRVAALFDERGYKGEGRR